MNHLINWNQMDKDIQERLGSAHGAQAQNPGKKKSDAKSVILTNFPGIFWQVKWKPGVALSIQQFHQQHHRWLLAFFFTTLLKTCELDASIHK